MIKINLSPFLIIAGLLICGACSNVRQAPVVEGPETDTAAEVAVQVVTETAGPDAAVGSGFGPPEDAGETWTELPPPPVAPPEQAPEAEAPAQAGHISDNPAVVALLDDTDLRLSQGNAEGAVSSVERALRLEPKNPWLWNRLAVLRLRQGQWRQAIALAEKSNSLSVKHPQVRKANATVIKLAGEQMKEAR